MKIALSGKGGSGKTTISATLARVFARQGLSVLAIDGDPNPNLGIALGLDAEQLAALQAVPRGIAVRETGEDGKSRMVVTKTIAQITADHSALAPDGVRLLVGSQVDHPGSGWLCSAHAAVRGIMGEIVASEDEMTVMDMEASLEHLSRGTVRHVDALLIVAEPYYRALETAARTVPLARGLGIERIYAIANKIRNPEDEKAVTDYCRTHDLEIIATIPFDEKVTTADRAGRAILDAAPDSHLVREVTALAGNLLEKLSNNSSSAMNKEPLPGEASGRC